MFGEIFPIRGEEFRNWLRTAGQEIFSLYPTGAEALDWLRGEGAAIRDADFYQIRREVLGASRYQEQIETYAADQLIPAAWHVQDHGLELSNQFLYRIQVFGTDPATGEQITKYFAVSSGRQLTPNEAADLLGELIVGEEEFYEIAVERMELYQALARPGTFG